MVWFGFLSLESSVDTFKVGRRLESNPFVGFKFLKGFKPVAYCNFIETTLNAQKANIKN